MARNSTTDNIGVLNQGLNPLVQYNFMLRVELIFDLPCKSVKGFTRENEYELIQEGGLNDYVHMRRKPISKPFTIEVERYVGVDYIDPMPNGADLVLPLLLFVSRYPGDFTPGITARTYIFTGCTVMKKTYGELDAEHAGLMTETTTLSYREMLCLDAPWSDLVKENNNSYKKGLNPVTASLDKQYTTPNQPEVKLDADGNIIPPEVKKGKEYKKPKAPAVLDADGNVIPPEAKQDRAYKTPNQPEVKLDADGNVIPPEVKKGKDYKKPKAPAVPAADGNAAVQEAILGQEKRYQKPMAKTAESVKKTYQITAKKVTDGTIKEEKPSGKQYVKGVNTAKATQGKHYPKDALQKPGEPKKKRYAVKNGKLPSLDKQYAQLHLAVTKSVDKVYAMPGGQITASIDKQYKRLTEPVAPSGKAIYTSPPTDPKEIQYPQ